MRVEAHTAIPQGVHRALTYVPWAIFHSAPILVLLGGLILLDIATTKAETIKRDRKEWKTVAVFLAVSAFFMLPTGSTHHAAATQSINTTGVPTATQESENPSDIPPQGLPASDSATQMYDNSVDGSGAQTNETQTQESPIDPNKSVRIIVGPDSNR